MRRDDDSDNDDDDNESLLLEFTPIRHRGNIKMVIFTNNIYWNFNKKKKEEERAARRDSKRHSFLRILSYM